MKIYQDDIQFHHELMIDENHLEFFRNYLAKIKL